MQVDYSLLTWPYKDGLHVQLAAYLAPVIADVERIGASACNPEMIVANLLGNISYASIEPGDTILSGMIREPLPSIFPGVPVDFLLS